MLIVRTPPTSFSPTNKKVLHCFCTVTSETQICNYEASTHQQSYGKSRGLKLQYITVLVLAALTPLCHMNQFGCGSSAIYAWPVDTSFESCKSVNSSLIDVLIRSQTPSRTMWAGGTLDLDIALGCSISGDILWLCLHLLLNSPLPASAVKTDKHHRLRSSVPGFTLCRAIHIVICSISGDIPWLCS